MSSDLEMKLPLVFFILLLASIPIIISIVEHKREKKRYVERDKLKARLVSDATRVISNRSASSLADIDDLYLSNFDTTRVLLGGRQVILSALRTVKRNISVELNLNSNFSSQTIKLTNDLIEEAEKIFYQESNKAPFAGVEDPERGFLEDIYEASEAKENEYLLSKLKELASALILRNKESKKYIDKQQESLRLSRHGLWATVGFSILSIALAIYFYTNGINA